MSKIADEIEIASDSSRDVSADLLNAFRELLLSRGYHRLSVRDVAEHAGVARSTFYEYFDGKEDLLGQSIQPLFSVLAECAVSDKQPVQLLPIVAHMWQHRDLGRRLLRGAMADVVVPVLAAEIEARCARVSILPLRLAAAQIAGAQIALLNAWDYTGVACKPEALAGALFATSRALSRALFPI